MLKDVLKYRTIIRIKIKKGLLLAKQNYHNRKNLNQNILWTSSLKFFQTILIYFVNSLILTNKAGMHYFQWTKI